MLFVKIFFLFSFFFFLFSFFFFLFSFFFKILSYFIFVISCLGVFRIASTQASPLLKILKRKNILGVALTRIYGSSTQTTNGRLVIELHIVSNMRHPTAPTRSAHIEIASVYPRLMAGLSHSLPD